MADETDFATFVRTHSTALLRSAFMLTGDRATAEDLLQETFTRLYPSWSKVVAADVPIAYVRRSLTNTFLNNRRRKSSQDVLFADPPDRGYDIDIAGRLGDQQLVRSLLDQLPPKQRAVLVLRFYEGLTDVEIADEVGCRRGTVRSILSRSLATLRTETERLQAADSAPTNGNQS